MIPTTSKHYDTKVSPHFLLKFEELDTISFTQKKKTLYDKQRKSKTSIHLCGQQLQFVRSHGREPTFRLSFKAHVSNTSIALSNICLLLEM